EGDTKLPSWLIGGSAVEVFFSVTYTSTGFLVPRDALVAGAVETRVFRMHEGKAQAISVDVIARTANEALVKARDGELAVGDKVVTRGNERLRAGQPLRTQE